jgi:hypothetical protein
VLGRSAMIIIMQRLHEGDVSGEITIALIWIVLVNTNPGKESRPGNTV